MDPVERWDHEEDIAPEARSRITFPFLDEFVASNVDIHYEAMDNAEFWIGVTCRETGRIWHLNVGAVSKRVKGYAMVELVDEGKPKHEVRPPHPSTQIGRLR